MGLLRAGFKRVISPKFVYNESRYSDSFIAKTPVNNEYHGGKGISRKIYCFWTGHNAMSAHRLNALELLQRTLKVEVVLVTPDKLNDFILNDFPLHKAYPYLSLVQKSDYLRSYFMHHFGGGYTDIKFFKHSWEPAFKKLETNPHKWLAGYREIGARAVAKVGGNVGNDLKKYWHILLGNGSFICRPYTPFTHEWYNELHKRMDYYHDDLFKNPGDAFGKNPGYPIPWANIMGYIFHPLCLKYHKRLLYSRKLKFVPKSYR